MVLVFVIILFWLVICRLCMGKPLRQKHAYNIGKLQEAKTSSANWH